MGSFDSGVPTYKHNSQLYCYANVDNWLLNKGQQLIIVLVAAVYYAVNVNFRLYCY